MVKIEAEALRRELNEWRDRSGLPRLEEPARGDGFNLVLNGEVEVIVPSTPNEDEENMEDECEDDLHHARSSEEVEEVARATTISMIKPSQSPTSAPSSANHQFSHNVSPPPVHQNGVTHTHSQQVPGGPQPHPAIVQFLHGRQHPHAAPHLHISTGDPMIASHQSPVSYENPAMIYDGYHPSQFGYNVPQSYTNEQLPPHILAQLEMEHKAAPGWYNNSTGQFTPPSSSGGPSPVGTPFGRVGGGLSGGYPVPQHRRYAEDGVVGRRRSSSIGSRESPVGSYELSGAHVENVPRWRDEGMVGVPGPNPAAYSLLM